MLTVLSVALLIAVKVAVISWMLEDGDTDR